MGGGLMQLVAYGAQDVYLTGNPQITFFKVIHRRHTNFAMESIQQTFSGQPDFGKKVTCTVSRNGDLITRVYLDATLPEVHAEGGSFAWVDYVGEMLVDSVELEIGGQRIDKQYGDWMHIWNQLSLPVGLQHGYKLMVGQNAARLACEEQYGCAEVDPACNLQHATNHVGSYKVHVPLQFWFCTNPGLALPLIALQYHEVKLIVQFRQFDHLYSTGCGGDNNVRLNGGSSVHLQDASLFIDYIYLDTDERRRFAQQPHEYLITQLQFTGEESVNGSSQKLKLNFNHPTKELVWVVQSDGNVANGCNDLTNYTVGGPFSEANPVASAKLQLNGHDRFVERSGRYFNLVQPFQHHSNVPRSHGINCYSFALKPEEHQPTGTCNMSRIDNVTLLMQLDGVDQVRPAKVRVYAVNYNVLRIMSGMGGLAYSN